MPEMIRRMWCDEDGQDLIEYVLIATFIAVVCIAAITIVGTDLSGLWNSIQTTVSSAAQ